MSPDPDLEKDRKRFCLSSEDGQAFITMIMQVRAITEEMERREANADALKDVEKLDKLTVTELEKRLIPALTKSRFGRWQIKETESVSGSLWITFTIQDLASRAEYDSRQDARAVLKKTLSTTKWQLATDGLHLFTRDTSRTASRRRARA